MEEHVAMVVVEEEGGSDGYGCGGGGEEFGHPSVVEEVDTVAVLRKLGGVWKPTSICKILFFIFVEIQNLMSF